MYTIPNSPNTGTYTLITTHNNYYIGQEYSMYIPCPIISFSLMEDDGIIRCGGRLSSNELLTKIPFLSSSDSAWAMWEKMQ